MDELTPEQRRQLADSASRQDSLQKATEQAIGTLEKQGGTLSDPRQARAAEQTARALRQQGTTQRQGQAARNVGKNALGQATGQQRKSAEELEAAAQKLREAANPDDPQALQKQIEQAIQKLAQLTQEQARAQSQTRKGMTAEQRRQLARLERKLQEQAKKLAQQLQKLQPKSPKSGKAAQSLSQASQSLGQASESLSQEQTEQAQQDQRQAMQSLKQAMQRLQQAAAEANKQQDPFAALRAKLRQLANQEKALHQATRRLEEERQTKGALPEHPAELKALAGKQAELEAGAGALQPDLPTEIFRSFGERARRAMQLGREGLEAANSGERPTQRAQARSIKLLEQLAKALQPDPKDNKRVNSSGGGGGGGGGGGKPDPELPKRLAELRLLRFMQQGILDDTQDADDRRAIGQKLTDADRARIADLGKNQDTAHRMTAEVAAALKRYRSLAAKVETAGKHMQEAHRGLSRQHTDDPVQEQERQAILRITQALQLTQQIAKQQQQRQQQQASGQQRRPGQRRLQAGKAQKGQQPAITELGRHPGRRGGALGRYAEENRGFRSLDPRDVNALKQGAREKVPAEYQDQINRYYRALSRLGKAGAR